ncbi:MAG: dihydroorotate dehydrogenase [Deltaproteobacteria bacterium]|nr:dihydroorotate dehydrogenase [Deltaproteobacteria bacterium]MBN2846801.1 dihydroorotate dehydrogenase [Deltaproteobacteria bacterium]
MAVDIGGLVLKNPVMTASGTFGYGEEYAAYIDLSVLGAIVVKGLSITPREGNPPSRIMETASGMLNAVGLENVGVRAFIDEKLPFLREVDVPVIANILGDTVEEYCEVAHILSEAEGIHALEVNISCPNVAQGGIDFGVNPELAFKVTEGVKNATDLPVIVKLTPNVTDITEIAKSVEDAGADAISLINTLTGLSIDIEKRIPHLKNITGGLSGPAIKPVALRMVWEVVRAVSVPVIGVGGIMKAGDALEFLVAGARAVQVGTANFVNPRSTVEIIKGIAAYMERKGIDDIKDLIGTLKT